MSPETYPSWLIWALLSAAFAALTAAANVRTLALVEVLFAQAVAYYSFKQPLSARELAGIVLIVAGVALLVSV